VCRPAQDPFLIVPGKERNPILHDLQFEEVGPDEPPRTESVVDTAQERPDIAVWHLLRLRGIVQGCSNVNIRKTREPDERAEPLAIGFRNVDHRQVVDYDVDAGEPFGHTGNLPHLVRCKEDVEHGSKLFRPLPQRIGCAVVQPHHLRVVDRTQAQTDETVFPDQPFEAARILLVVGRVKTIADEKPDTANLPGYVLMQWLVYELSRP
jgi:hypothetical protein